MHFECADDSLIAERHEALCSLLRNLAGGAWAVWSHRVHRVVDDAMEEPGAGFAHDLSQAYYAKLAGKRLMRNELYLTLVYRPHASKLAGPSSRRRADAGGDRAGSGRGAARDGGDDRPRRAGHEGLPPGAAGDPPPSRSRLLGGRGVPGDPGQRTVAGDAAKRRSALSIAADDPPLVWRRQAGAAPRRRASLCLARRPARVRRRRRAGDPQRPALRAERVHRDAELLYPAEGARRCEHSSCSATS